MPNLVCLADGNFATAGTWATVDATALLSTSTGVTALTTADQDSAVFAPGAITVDAIALKLGAIQAGAAHDGTLTITLRNSTDSADTVSLAYTIAQLCNNGESVRAGWYLFKLDASYLLHAVDNYIIRLKVSATAGKPTVSFMTNGIAANWQHMLRIPGTTAAPAAGNDLFILGELAAPASWTTRTVTMNETATTDYGAGSNESEHSPALAIGKNGTLTWGTAGATAYILKLSGSLIIYPGGAMNMGTTGTACPRDSSMDLQFDTAASKLYKLYVIGGAVERGTLVMQGLSRTVGKLVDKCKLNQDLAVNGTTCNVDTDTGWLLGDEVVIAPTDRTYTHDEPKTLTTGNAGASSFTVAAVTYAHLGTSPTFADIILLTRNVRVRALNTTYPGIVYCMGMVDFDWARFTDFQVSAALNTVTGGSVNCDYCAQDGAPTTYNVVTDTTSSDFHFRHLVAHMPGANGGAYIYIAPTAATNWTLQNVTQIGGTYGIYLSDLMSANAITGLTCIGAYSGGIYVTGDTGAGSGFGVVPSLWTAYCCNALGIHVRADSGFRFLDQTFQQFTAWGNMSWGVEFAAGTGFGFVNCIFDRFTTFGNATGGVRTGGHFLSCQAWDWLVAGFSGMAQAAGVGRNQPPCMSLVEIAFYNCLFGVATGGYATHTTADFVEGSSGASTTEVVRYKFRGSVLASTEFDAHTYVADRSYYSSQRHDQTDLMHKSVFFGRGTVAYEVTTYKTTAPSIKMTPTSATKKLNGGIMRFAVSNGVSCSVQVQVRKSAAYDGSAPRLVVLRNDAIGITVDAVIDTLSVAADTWELLTGVVVGSPIDDGVVEVYVDCDGTAGQVYVDEWAKS